MRSRWLLVPFLALVGCDSLVSGTGTGSEGDGSTGSQTSSPGTETSPIPIPTTTGVDPSTTTDGPSTTGSESSTAGLESSSGSTGFGSSGGGDSSSESSSTTDPTGVGFIDPSDSGPGGNECDSYLQDCPDGEKCNPWANDGGGNWNALGCFPVDPMPDQPGDPCVVEGSGVSGIDSCDLGSMCWDVDGDTSNGTCIALCEGSAAMPTCSDPSASCVISNGGVLNLCLPGCDPLFQGCPGNQGCYPIDDTFVCAPDASGEQGSPGDPCEFVNVCDPGAGCIQAESFGPSCAASACCSLFCDLSDPNCPIVGQECVPWFEEGAAPPQFVDVGVCSVPA